ncbi:MAG: DUF4249 domain-containing protein [Bacteroidales bacterium]|nr:DUF4249 domain-containing protein [Bacteroidales bacterium]
MKSKYLLLFLSIALSSCMDQEQYTFSEGDIEPLIVLNALWESADTTQTIDVRRTGLVATSEVNDYQSSLTVNGSVIDPTEMGTYHYQPQPGDEVELSVQVGPEQVSASACVPQPVIIEGIDTVHVFISTDKVFQRTQECVRFMIHLRLPEGAEGTQYFRLAYTGMVREFMNCVIEGGRIKSVDYYYDYFNDYYYDSDMAMCENRNMMADHSDEFPIDIARSVPNLYGLFSSRSFVDGRYTLIIDVPNHRKKFDTGVVSLDRWRSYSVTFDPSIEHRFRILTVPQIEYNYLWSVAALTEMYDADDLVSNPPIVPSNINGGTGIFSIGAAAEATFEGQGEKLPEVGDPVEITND